MLGRETNMKKLITFLSIILILLLTLPRSSRSVELCPICPNVLSVSDYPNLLTAVTEIGSAVKTLMVPSNQSCSSFIAVPSTLTLWFIGSGQITKSPGCAITFNSSPQGWPIRQLFVGFSEGDIKFDRGAMSPLYSEFWATNTSPGITDMAQALQSAFDAHVDVFRPIPVKLFSTDYGLSTTLSIIGQKGFRFSGDSEHASRLLWNGVGGVPMLLIQNSESVEIAHIRFEGKVGSAPSAAIQSNINPPTAIPGIGVTDNHFHDLFLGSSVSNSLQRGIRYTTSGVDQNNDASLTDHVVIQGFSVAGISFEHSQSVAHSIRNTTIQFGPVGVQTVNGGSFRWHGGLMLALTTTCFELGSGPQTVAIDGLWAESNKRLVTGTHPIGMPLVIQNTVFSNDQLHTDGNMIDYAGGSPITLIGNRFGSFDLGIPYVRIAPNGSVTYTQIVSIGNSWLVNQTSNPPPSPFRLDSTTKLVSLGDGMSIGDATMRALPTIME